ncbi:hypothetical protein CCP3SC15_3430003 [Gammaproteobacteria bacterium]
MVETFNAEDAPHIIIGHSSDYKGKTRIPSFGQIIGGLKRVGSELIAVGAQFNEKLAGWIKEGFYNQRSIEMGEVGGKKKIVALGMLGACPPAVKCLPGMDEALNDIALTFSEAFKAVEFSETTALEFDAVEEAENIGKEDTKKNISECLATLNSALSDMIDKEEKAERIRQEVYEYMDDLFRTLGIHDSFMQKLEQIEVSQEKEMSSVATWIKEFKEKFITKGKGEDVDKQKEDGYKQKIADLEANVQEFADLKAAEEEKRVKAEQEARDASIKAEIKSFLDANGKNLKITEEMQLPELMFQIAKTQATIDFSGEKKSLLVVFQELLTKLPTVQLGESKEFNEQGAKPDNRPAIIKAAEEFYEKNTKEFAGLDKAQVVAKILRMNANGDVKLEIK